MRSRPAPSFRSPEGFAERQRPSVGESDKAERESGRIRSYRLWLARSSNLTLAVRPRRTNDTEMTFRDCIRRQRIIAVDLRPSMDVLWTGVCIKDTGQIALFINLDEQRRRLDGFTVFRSKEISRYRLCDRTECRGVSKRYISDYVRPPDLRRMVDVASCLRIAAAQGPIAFFTGGDTHSYWVGNLVSLRRAQARFRLIDKKANLGCYQTIEIQNIDFFCFDSEYERRLARQLAKNRSNNRSTSAATAVLSHRRSVEVQ